MERETFLVWNRVSRRFFYENFCRFIKESKNILQFNDWFRFSFFKIEVSSRIFKHQTRINMAQFSLIINLLNMSWTSEVSFECFSRLCLHGYIFHTLESRTHLYNGKCSIQIDSLIKWDSQTSIPILLFSQSYYFFV